jgi:hypothetical protein
MPVGTYSQMVDTHVDNVWGEPCKLLPWQRSEEMIDGVPDMSRPVVSCVGVYILPRPVPISMGAIPGQRAGGGGAWNARELESDVVLSIRQQYVDRCQLQKGDRVTFNLREGIFEVAFVPPSATDRPRVGLIRLKD